MSPRPFRACALLALLAGCASDPAVSDPRAALEPLIATYAEIEAERGSAEYADNSLRPIRDRGLLRSDIEVLALEFPDDPETLFAAALVAFDAKRYARAGAYLDRMFQVQRAHPDAAVLRSQVALKDGNRPLARRVLEEQLVLVPDDPALREALAGVYFEQGEHDLAREQLALAEELGAPAWRIDFNLGLLAEREDRPAEARQLYLSCLELNSTFAPARSRLRLLQLLPDPEPEAPAPTPAPAPAPARAPASASESAPLADPPGLLPDLGPPPGQGQAE